MNSIFTRRSIREYDSCPVEQELSLIHILRTKITNKQPDQIITTQISGIFAYFFAFKKIYKKWRRLWQNNPSTF